MYFEMNRKKKIITIKGFILVEKYCLLRCINYRN